MYSRLVVRAAPAEISAYQYFTYHGRSLEIPYRGISIPLTKNQVIGVRRNDQQICMIFDEDINRVFLLSSDLAAKIAKKVKVHK